jgi:hypothetical protein
VTPDTPLGINASDGSYNDRVRLTWGAASGATSYRVYRNTTNNPGAAQQLTQTTGTSYDDFTAAPPSTQSSGGCGGGSTVQYTTYYYWVVALSLCAQSPFAGPDTGYRGGAKSASQGVVTPQVLPSKALSPYVALDGPLALRLQAGEPIDPSSVWGEVTGGDFVDTRVTWVPLDASGRDGWVAYQPAVSWTPGETIGFTAGASTRSGVPLKPVRAVYQADPEGAVETAAKNTETGGVTATPVAYNAVPDFVEGVGMAYLVTPQAVFSGPQRVWFPLPQGTQAKDLTVYYYAGSGPDGSWHPGGMVTGWLASDDIAVASSGGFAYVGFLLQYGGVARLGYRANAPAASQAGLVSTGGDALANMVNIGVIVLILYGAYRLSARRKTPTGQPR